MESVAEECNKTPHGPFSWLVFLSGVYFFVGVSFLWQDSILPTKWFTSKCRYVYYHDGRSPVQVDRLSSCDTSNGCLFTVCFFFCFLVKFYCTRCGHRFVPLITRTESRFIFMSPVPRMICFQFSSKSLPFHISYLRRAGSHGWRPPPRPYGACLHFYRETGSTFFVTQIRGHTEGTPPPY